MFIPQPSNAHAFPQGPQGPAGAVFWWPGRSFVSCDGRLAVNTGPWVREWGKSVGYFTTVWQRQRDGSWQWIYDGGDALKAPRAEGGDIKPQAGVVHAASHATRVMLGTDRRGRLPQRRRALGRRDAGLVVDGRAEAATAASSRSCGTAARFETVVEDQVARRAMIELFTTAFITLAVIIDPPGCAPIFASLTSGTDAAHRRRMAIRSSLVAWCILVFFALLGEPLLGDARASASAPSASPAGSCCS